MHVLNSCFKPIAVVTRKLEDVLDAKNGAIKNLQYELARVCKVKFFQILILRVDLRVITNIFRLITTSCVRMKRNSPLLGFPWMRLDSNRSNRQSPDKKSERDQPVLFLLPHKNFYILCNCIKKINLLCNINFFLNSTAFVNNQCSHCKLSRFIS